MVISDRLNMLREVGSDVSRALCHAPVARTELDTAKRSDPGQRENIIMLKRSYYQASASEFLSREEAAILGELVSAHGFDIDVLQRRSWQHQIQAIKQLLKLLPFAYVFFEFAIPRMGKRADVVLLVDGIVFVVEYKVWADVYASNAIEQSLDYAVDLKNFHEGSHKKKIVPILVD